jgi:hypothetical protein
VFADLREIEDGDRRRWALDTGATNHMTGSREIFIELDSEVCGTVHFGDGSITMIEGRGSIILACKDGVHRTLTGVYFIPCLKASIISLGHLDEMGCRIDVKHGVLCIFDSGGQLLAKVVRDQSRLYYLALHIDQLVCLSAWCTEAAWLWHGRFGHLNFGALRAWREACRHLIRWIRCATVASSESSDEPHSHHRCIDEQSASCTLSMVIYADLSRV